MAREVPGLKKKNPAVGTPGQGFLLLSEFTVSSMRPGCTLIFSLLDSRSFFFYFFLFLLLIIFRSNLTEAHTLKREFLSFCALTESPWTRHL
jgi:hypothetical protein